MKKEKSEKEQLRSFGITMGIAFLIITGLIALKHRHSLIPASVFSAFFFIAGLLIPAVLKPIHIFWMKLAHVLSWINTRLLLCVVFYVLFFPIGLIMKLFGFDPLDRKLERDRSSYWQERKKPGSGTNHYEKQF
jgi:hypothetical protein